MCPLFCQTRHCIPRFSCLTVRQLGLGVVNEDVCFWQKRTKISGKKTCFYVNGQELTFAKVCAYTVFFNELFITNFRSKTNIKGFVR